MADVTVTARKVSPLPGAIALPYDLGAAATVGDSVYLSAGDTVSPTDSDSAGTSASIGIIVAIGTMGATTGIAGDRCSVVRYGPVAGFSGATPNGQAFVSGTLGKVADAAGTTSRVLGRFDSANVLFVNPPA